MGPTGTSKRAAQAPGEAPSGSPQPCARPRRRGCAPGRVQRGCHAVTLRPPRSAFPAFLLPAHGFTGWLLVGRSSLPQVQLGEGGPSGPSPPLSCLLREAATQPGPPSGQGVGVGRPSCRTVPHTGAPFPSEPPVPSIWKQAVCVCSLSRV